MAMCLGFAPPEGLPSRAYVGVVAVDAPPVATGEDGPGVAPAEGAAPTTEDPGEPAPETFEGPAPDYDEEAALDDEDDLFFDDEGGFEEDDYDPLRDSPEALEASGWVRSGIVFSVVGGVLAIGGVLMALSDPMDLAAGNGSQKLARDRAAQAMGVPGGALMAGGIAMIVVGKRKKKRLGASLEALRRGVGVGMTLRF